MSGLDTSEHEPGEASLEMDVRDLGLDPAQYDTDELDLPIVARPLLLRNTLLERAESWVGKDFSGSSPEQCANFIRRLLKETGIWVPPTSKPFDLHLTQGLPQGGAFANSFFSAANGRLLGYGDISTGDLIAFRDTYEGDFPRGCITHVGLYLGYDVMIDRATAGQPVRRQLLDRWWKERFVVGLRPHQLC